MIVSKPAKPAQQTKQSSSIGSIAFHLIVYTLFTLFALVCIYPLYYLLICTISDNKLVELGQILLVPRGIHFDNYIEIFRVQNIGYATLVSLVRTVGGTASGVFCTAYLAYFFSKEDMWKRKFWYRFVIVTMYFSAGLIPVYLNNRMLGLVNTFWIYVVPSLVSVYNLVLIKTSIEAMPPDLEESAYLDGAGYFQRLFRIVLPLQKPILATVSLFSAVGHWNDFFTTKLYVTKPKLYTLQFLLYELLNQVQAAAEQITSKNPFATITPVSIRLTLTAIVVIPIMLVYPFIQKHYVKGLMVGAVKG